MEHIFSMISKRINGIILVICVDVDRMISSSQSESKNMFESLCLNTRKGGLNSYVDNQLHKWSCLGGQLSVKLDLRLEKNLQTFKSQVPLATIMVAYDH